jgi:putative proteasome-type protease
MIVGRFDLSSCGAITAALTGNYHDLLLRNFVRDGLVMFADTRTNAGVDNISTFRKLHVFCQPGERIMAIATSGNLSISQSVVSMRCGGWENPETGETETLMSTGTMFQSAQSVGEPSERSSPMRARRSPHRCQIRRLVSVRRPDQRRAAEAVSTYSAATSSSAQDTPYLQIGEHKYGKPVLDRAITRFRSYDALKIGLVSVD